MREESSILIVEDERLVAEDLRATLEQHGYPVVAVVGSGERAIEKAEALRPHLVLMDINLDGKMDGISAAAAIRQRHGTPVVYLTAFSNDETLARARGTDAFGFIVKPFQEKGVIAAIEMALGKHQAEHARLQREEMMRSGLMNLPLGVIMTDQSGCIVFANATARHHIGRSLDGEAGVPLDQVFLETSPLLGAPPGSALPEERGAILEMTGRRLDVAYSQELLRGDDGREIGRIIIYQDALHPPPAGELGRLLRSFLQSTRATPQSPAAFVTICAWSKRIKVDDQHWVSFEDFLTHYVGLNVTHGMAPEIARQWSASGFRGQAEAPEHPAG